MENNLSSTQGKEKIEREYGFKNVRSNYMLKKMFNFLRKKKLLEIIHYCKTIQKRLNIDINDFKEYLEIYSAIEIIITPIRNKYGKFVNIKKGEESYYHIYFNDNEKEENIYRIERGNNIHKIKIIIDYQIISFSKLFFSCNCIRYIYFKKFNRNNINDMFRMFSGCKYLKKIDLSNFNTNSVTDMSGMFSGCESLEELNLSNFYTNNVITMNSMFNNCSSLIELNLSNFNTNNVIYMSNIFEGCSSLEKLNLSNFNVDKLIESDFMFGECPSLKSLNLSLNFEEYLKKIKNISSFPKKNIFDECPLLKKYI